MRRSRPGWSVDKDTASNRRMTRASRIESESVEWGVMDDDGRVTKCPAEHDARDYQAGHGGELVYRMTIHHTRRLGGQALTLSIVNASASPSSQPRLMSEPSRSARITTCQSRRNLLRPITSSESQC